MHATKLGVIDYDSLHETTLFSLTALFQSESTVAVH